MVVFISENFDTSYQYLRSCEQNHFKPALVQAQQIDNVTNEYNYVKQI